MDNRGIFSYVKTYYNIHDDLGCYINYINIYKFNCHAHPVMAFTNDLDTNKNFSEIYKTEKNKLFCLIAFDTIEEMDQWMQSHSCTVQL